MAAILPTTNSSLKDLETLPIDIYFSDFVVSKDIEHEATQSPEKNELQGEKGVLGRVLRRIDTRSTWIDLEPPPDGGLAAWLQVLFGHIVILNTWGIINSFGIFQSYYVTALSRDPADISWIGSIQVFLIFFVGTFSGRLTDAGYFRSVFIGGALIGCIGLFMTSLSTTYWQIFFTHGICCGLGYGWMFCPTASLISSYFNKKRSLATGILAAGSATGGVIFPLMVQQLLPTIGFAWTMRSMAFIQLGCLAVCTVGLKPRVPPRRTGALIDIASFKDLPYVLYGIAMFFTFLGVYIAFYYIASFARSIIGLPYAESTNLLVVLNAVGVIGRVIPNYLADRYFGALNTMIVAVVISSLLSFCWIAVTSRGGLYVWAVIYGTSGACIQGLLPATLSSLTTDMSKAGTRMGQVFTVISFGALIGPPISGILIRVRGGGYEFAQIFAGSAMLVGGGFHIAAKMANGRPAPSPSSSSPSCLPRFDFE